MVKATRTQIHKRNKQRKVSSSPSPSLRIDFWLRFGRWPSLQMGLTIAWVPDRPHGTGYQWVIEYNTCSDLNLATGSSSTSSLHALDAPKQHPSMNCDWIDLTALADNGSHLDMSQFPSPALVHPVTPPQPSKLPDPSFMAVSDVDITLENPWAPSWKFKF